jgi:hypothetical protein
MKAEKVFEQFGFELTYNDNYLIEYKRIINVDEQPNLKVVDIVAFYKTLGTVELTHKVNGKMFGSITLTMELYAAITRQLKELGWIVTTAQDDDEMEQDGVEIR